MILPKLTTAQKREVKETLQKCQLYMQLGFHPGVEQKVTAELTEEDRAKGIKRTEEVAIKNADTERERREFVGMVLSSLERLNDQEKRIIREYFLDKNKKNDEVICDFMHIGKSSYYSMKNDALVKLAMMWNIA